MESLHLAGALLLLFVPRGAAAQSFFVSPFVDTTLQAWADNAQAKARRVGK